MPKGVLLCLDLVLSYTSSLLKHGYMMARGMTLSLATKNSAVSPATHTYAHTHVHKEEQICTVFAMGELLIYINYG